MQRPEKESARPAPGKKRRLPLWACILLGCLCAVVLLAGAAALYVNGKLDLIQYHDGSVDSVGTIGADEDQDLDTAGLVENTDEMVMPEGSPFEDSDVLNILLISTDERTDAVNDWDAFTHLNELDGTSATTEFSDNARADSLILVSLNIAQDTIKLVSIERATGVPILLDGYEGEYDWITHTFRYGGARLTMDTVEDCFNIAVDHYVRINFNSFVQIVDAVGGVDIELTEEEAAALNWEVPSNSMLIVNEVSPGGNHMDGYTALQYARLRSIDNDWVRTQRQRTVIQAVLDQIKSATPLELDNLLNTVLPLVQTNFTRSEITALLVQLPGFLGATAEQMTLPVEGTYGVRTGMDDRQMYDPDWAENIAVLHDFLYGEDSDYYPHGETAETSLGEYTDGELEELTDYLVANTQPVSLEDGSGLWYGTAGGEEDGGEEPRVYLLGDDFAASDGVKMRRAMVTQLYAQGVRYLVTEDGLAEGMLLDQYIAGGDEALLEACSDAHGGLPEAQLEFYRWLREYNAGLDESERLRLVGLGADVSPLLTARALDLLRQDDAGGLDESVEDIAYWLDRTGTQPTGTGGRYILLRMRQELEDGTEALETLFGENLALAEQLCASAQAGEEFAGGEGGDARWAEVLYDHFCLVEELLPEDARFYGSVSLEAASATALTGRGESDYTTFAALLEGSGSPVRGQVAAAAALYLPAGGDTSNALPNDRTFDYTLLGACLPDALTRSSWIVLDGQDSPFADSAALFQPGEEGAGAAADYFPALLTVVPAA